MSANDLVAVIKRLEVATLRLEEIVRSKGPSGEAAATAIANVTRDLASLSTSNSNPASGFTHPAVTAFDELIHGSLGTYFDLAEKIGGLVEEQAQHVREAFSAQRSLIEIAANSKKPVDSAAFHSLLGPTTKEIESVAAIREKNRPSPLFNHLSAVSEGIPALGWVLIEPAPAPFIAEFKDSSLFYSNRVIKDAGDKKESVDFVRSYGALLTDLQAYVKKYHTTGLSWNPKGASSTATSAPAPAASGSNALFGALSKEGLTSGLRKVDKSEMTHKNPELRSSSVVPASVATTDKESIPASTSRAAAVKAPRKELVGNKWSVENFTDDANVVIESTELRHVVYIYNCKNSTISVKGKVNAVTIDNCTKTGVLLEHIVSSVDVVNSKSSQVQVTGIVPTVSVDKTDGLQLFLSKASIDADVSVFTAKSTEVNVMVEGAGEDGGYAERAVPEQLKSVVKDGRLVTLIVEHVA